VRGERRAGRDVAAQSFCRATPPAASGLRWRPLLATSRATSSSVSSPSSWASAPLPRIPGKRGWAHGVSSISLPCRSSSIEGEWQRDGQAFFLPNHLDSCSSSLRNTTSSSFSWLAGLPGSVNHRSQRGRPTRVAEATKGLPLGRKRDLARWLHACYSPGGRGGNDRRRVALANATSDRPWRLALRVLPRPGHRWSISSPQDGAWVEPSEDSWPRFRQVAVPHLPAGRRERARTASG
jgi:hypothetical protein